ncbi:MAG: LacI family DNA-binding transcriptional regulator [Planctomycetota bacterium]
MKSNSPRLIDIAERAKLSVTSISRILGGQRLSEYSPATQERVRKIAEEMGWRPNLVVRGMKTGQTHTFGVFMAPYDTFWTGVVYGIHDTLLDAKQVPLVLWPHALVHPTLEAADPDGQTQVAARNNATPGGAGLPGSHVADPEGSERRELDRINCLEDRRVDAILSWPLHERNARERLTMLSSRGWRVVTIDDALPAPAKSIYVGGDETGTMRTVRDHLAGLGHQRVAYVGVDRQHTWARRRKAAFAEVWPDRDACPMLDLEYDDGSCSGEALAFIQAHPRTTAVVAATDHLARQITRALMQAGRCVPDDLSIVGYGNDAFGSGDVPLTTVDQQPYEVGCVAARVALQKIKPQDRQVLVPTRLLTRRSTQPAKG